MKTAAEQTDVMFRETTVNDWKGEIYALFPHQSYGAHNLINSINSYAHVGQHSGADYNHCMRTSRPAKYVKYHPLLMELEGLGYNLNIVNRQTKSKIK